MAAKNSIYPDLAPQKRYGRIRDVLNLLCTDRTTLYRWSKERADFPKPIKAGPRVTLFDLDAIEAWIAKQGEQA